MRRLLVAVACGLMAGMSLAGPASARDFGAVFVDDEIYRVFGNAANVPDGTGTDPFATFTNSTNSDQRGVAQFAPAPLPATMAVAGRCTAQRGRHRVIHRSSSQAGLSSRRLLQMRS